MLEAVKPERKPDNTLTMEINGTTYIIDEFLSETSKDTVNDIIYKRIKRDFNPLIPKVEKG